MKRIIQILLLISILLVSTTDAGGRQRRKRKDNERDITPEEVIEIEEDKTEIADDEDALEKKSMMEEWDAHMSDFVPEDMLTIDLGTREEISLHEFADSSKRGMQYIRGAYFVNSGQSTEKKQLIDFFVLDPNYQVIYSRRGKDEGIFRFNTTMQGQYSFVFSNMGDKK